MTARNSEQRELVRRELLGASEQLCSKNDQSELGLSLRSHVPNLECALILEWVPEQAEDIYWVLTGFNEIAKVEIPRGRSNDEEPASLQKMDVATYRRKRHSKEVREKLEIALELVRG